MPAKNIHVMVSEVKNQKFFSKTLQILVPVKRILVKARDKVPEVNDRPQPTAWKYLPQQSLDGARLNDYFLKKHDAGTLLKGNL